MSYEMNQSLSPKQIYLVALKLFRYNMCIHFDKHESLDFRAANPFAQQ